MILNEMSCILATTYRMMIDGNVDWAKNNQKFVRLCVTQKVPSDLRNRAASVVTPRMKRLAINNAKIELFHLEIPDAGKALGGN